MARGAAASLGSALFWDGVAWAGRWFVACAHVLFMIPALLREELLETLPAYRLFSELLPFQGWAGLSFLACALLIAVPTRVPFGLVSTTASGALWFVCGAVFSQGVGFVFGSLICYGLGALSMALFMRSLWAWAVRVGWFQRHVLRGHHGGG